MDFNVETLIDTIMKVPPEEMESKQAKLIGAFPNTYSFTKAMSERILLDHVDGLPFCMVRPTIIGAAMSEPLPGWLDSISAAASIYLFAGLGILKYLHGRIHNIGD